MTKYFKGFLVLALLTAWPVLLLRNVDFHNLFFFYGFLVPVGQWYAALILGKRLFGIRCWGAYLGAVLAFVSGGFFSIFSFDYLLVATPLFAAIGLAVDLRRARPFVPKWSVPILLALPLLFYWGLCLSSYYEDRHRGAPSQVNHGSFTGDETFRLANLLQVEVRSAGKASFELKYWAPEGQQASCMEYAITTSAGLFRVDDCGAGQWDAEINGRWVHASSDHHILIDASGKVKVAEGAIDMLDPAYDRMVSVDAPYVSDGHSAYIVGDGPMYSWLEERCRTLHMDVAYAFNTDFKRLLPEARGKDKILVVLAVGDRLVLPDAYWTEYAGIDASRFRKRISGERASRLDHRLADGTKVVVLYGRTREDIAKLIKQFQ